jgi:hypothetical protein
VENKDKSLENQSLRSRRYNHLATQVPDFLVLANGDIEKAKELAKIFFDSMKENNAK